MKIRRQRSRRCEGCGKTIPAWWFSTGDQQGWWHWWCIIKDSWRKSR